MLAIAAAEAQQPTPAPGQGAAVLPQTQGGPAAGGGRGRRGSPPVPYDDYAGFTKLWDGQTLNNWDGEADVWSIDNGAIHADTTKTPGQHHIHYKGPGAVMKDFDVKVEFKLSPQGANAGVQYRSRLLHASHAGTIDNPLGKPLPANIRTFAEAVAAGLATEPAPRGTGGGPGRGNDPNAPGARGGPPGRGLDPGAAGGPPAPTGPCTAGGFGNVGGGGRGAPPGPNGPTTEPNPWQVSGYQFDIDSNNVFTGQLYEGQGRGIVTAPGTIVELLPARQTACIGVVEDDPRQYIKPHRGLEGDWNQLEIVARGYTLIHMINGHVISVSVDDNPEFRAAQGILSLQLEGSGQVWYRNVYVKSLDK